MSIPRAFALLGLLAASGLLAAVGFLTAFTLNALVRAAERTQRSTYASIVGAALGGPARLALLLALFGGCYGLLVVYLVVVADVLVGSAPNFDGLVCDLLPVGASDGGGAAAGAGGGCGAAFPTRRLDVMAAFSLALLPLAARRDMASLAAMNVVGVAAVALFAAAAVGVAAAAAAAGTAAPIPLLPDWAALAALAGGGGGGASGGGWGPALHGAVAVVPLLLTACVCHQSITPLMPLLKPWSRRRMGSVVSRSLAACSGLYVTIAACCLAAFGARAIDADVLNNVTGNPGGRLAAIVGPAPAAAVAAAVRVAFLLALAGSYLLMLYPLRECAIEIVFHHRHFGRRLHALFLPLTLFLAGSAWAIAGAVPNIFTAIALIGAVSSTVTAFIFPAALVLGEPGAGRGRRAGAAAVGALGAALLVNGVAAALR